MKAECDGTSMVHFFVGGSFYHAVKNDNEPSFDCGTHEELELRWRGAKHEVCGHEVEGLPHGALQLFHLCPSSVQVDDSNKGRYQLLYALFAHDVGQELFGEGCLAGGWVTLYEHCRGLNFASLDAAHDLMFEAQEYEL